MSRNRWALEVWPADFLRKWSITTRTSVAVVWLCITCLCTTDRRASLPLCWQAGRRSRQGRPSKCREEKYPRIWLIIGKWGSCYLQSLSDFLLFSFFLSFLGSWILSLTRCFHYLQYKCEFFYLSLRCSWHAHKYRFSVSLCCLTLSDILCCASKPRGRDFDVTKECSTDCVSPCPRWGGYKTRFFHNALALHFCRLFCWN